MCGIAGILKSKGNRVTPDELHQLNKPIRHRGPDGEGYWISFEGTAGLAHRRLSIIDLSENAKQPMHYKDGRYTITFNGEIYNYVELREELLKAGCNFRSHSDTEVILALYDLKREKCLSDLDGMFAFAIWDEQQQQLFCARDRFGEKPFYYHRDNDQMVFASEIKQFWSFGVPKKISMEKVSRFVTEREIINDAHPEKTFYEGIFALKAAHYMLCRPGQAPEIRNYWNLDGIKKDTKISFEEAALKFTELFNKSVSRRLRSDVPLGSSLSGGLDSSCIVYTIHQKFLKPGQKQFTFSARFKNFEKDEGKYIDALLTMLPGIQRSEIFLDADEFENDMDAIAYHQDEPFQSSSIFAQYKVMQVARKHGITVMLDGQGADELMGGYENLYIDYLKQLFYNNPAMYGAEAKAYNDMHASKYGVLDLYKNDTTLLKVKRNVKRVLKRTQAVPQDYFSGVLKNYIGGAQLQQLLRYADRNAMAHSVETRLPYLSHELVEYVFSLPDHYKMKEGWPKYLLRKTFDGKLPAEITWRKNKVGFETPESNFLNTEKALNRIRESKHYLLDHKIQVPQEKMDPWVPYILSRYLS